MNDQRNESPQRRKNVQGGSFSRMYLLAMVAIAIAIVIASLVFAFLRQPNKNAEPGMKKSGLSVVVLQSA